ncbi:MAG: CoA transferase [Rhodospirillales bacterium]|nr:CoA transferase [Rhodospirillales bacterium]
MVYTDRHWQSFAVALGEDCHFRDDPRYANMEARSANITEIYTELAALLLTRTTTGWMDLFNGADIPAMPLHTLETLIEDPQLAATGFFGEIDHPSEGKLRSIGVPSSWTETQPAPSRHAPRLGEHSAEVLGEYGYGDDEIAALMADGVTQAPAN